MEIPYIERRWRGTTLLDPVADDRAVRLRGVDEIRVGQRSCAGRVGLNEVIPAGLEPFTLAITLWIAFGTEHQATGEVLLLSHRK